MVDPIFIGIVFVLFFVVVILGVRLHELITYKPDPEPIEPTIYDDTHLAEVVHDGFNSLHNRSK